MAGSAESAHQSGHDVRRRGPGETARRAAEERLAPTAVAARAAAAEEHQASLARVVVAQESRDEEMTEAFVTNNAENVKPRVEVSREDSTEADQSNGRR